MQKINIVSDSVCNIPEELAGENNITIIPMCLSIEGELYREGIDISPDEVYRLLEEGKRIITHTPTIGDFIKAYEKVFSENEPDFIYSIHLSSLLSGTYNAAVQAARNFPAGKVEVINSRLAALSLGFVVLEAARSAIRRIDKDKIEKRVEYLIEKSAFFATFGNFEYIFKGGRAPFFKKFIGKSIRLNPIVTFSSNGKVKLKKFSMSRESSILELARGIKDVKKRDKAYEISKLGICCGANSKDADRLAILIKEKSGIIFDEIIFNKMTAVMGVHTGPDILGAGVCPAILPEGI